MKIFTRVVQSVMHALLCGLALFASPFAQAQPTVGAVLQDVLPLGSGSSAPLPPGRWKVTLVTDVPAGKLKWQAYVLKSLDPQSPIAALIVRDMNERVAWGATGCENNSNPNAFMKNVHGTASNQLTNKCSRVWTLGRLGAWRDSTFTRSDNWWKWALPGLNDLDGNEEKQFVLLDLQMQQFNDRAVQYQAFVQPPLGLTGEQFLNSYKAGQLTPEHQLLQAWIELAMESLQQSYLQKKPRPALMPLGYKTQNSNSVPAVAAGVPLPAFDSAAVYKFLSQPPAAVLPPASALQTAAINSVFQDSLSLGANSSLSLPAGKWKLAHTTFVPQGKAYVLTSLEALSPVSALVIRESDVGAKWDKALCEKPDASAFMVNAHGTQSSQVVNKCSRIFAIDNWSSWRTSAWWRDIQPGLGELEDSYLSRLLMVALRVNQSNGRILNYELFVQPPLGLAAKQFRDTYRTAPLTAEHHAFGRWVSALMESMSQSYLEKKPQPGLMALGYKTQGRAGVEASPVQVAGLPLPAFDSAAVYKFLSQPPAAVFPPASEAARLAAAPHRRLQAALVNSVFQDALDLGSNSSVSLPEGKWRLTHTALNPQRNAYVLASLEPLAPVAALVIRESGAGAKWDKALCEKPDASAFMVNAYGTQSSQLVDKCSRVFAINSWSDWRSTAWWRDIQPGLDGLEDSYLSRLLMVELRAQQAHGRELVYELFVQPPLGVTAKEFRDTYRSAPQTAEHHAFGRWVSALMESLSQSYLDKNPQPGLMALGYKTQGRAVVEAAPTPVFASTPPPVNVTMNASVAALGNAAPKPAALQYAQDIEARELRQQLEKMQVMIAQLQAANAASAKVAQAAQAAEIIAAAPVAKPPAAKPILANRKALIIGNDL